MKTYFKSIIYVIIILTVLSCAPVIYTQPTQEAPPPQQQIYTPPVDYYGPQPSYQVFYDQLSPYGVWVEYQNYGYVWMPRVGSDFEPYATQGHWVYTEQGWAWFSDYNWGWAPFHYGRWVFDDYYGWIWVPGHEWAPAWVTWGYYNNYYCWAPLGPGDIHYDSYRPSHHYWHYVPSNHITENNVNNYIENNTTVVNNVTNITIINNSTTINNVTYNQGPKKEEVEKSVQKKITVLPAKEITKPAPSPKNNTKAIEKTYTPNKRVPVNKPNVPNISKEREVKNNQVNPAPKKVEKLQNIQPYHRQPNTEKQQMNKNPESNPKMKEQKPLEKKGNGGDIKAKPKDDMPLPKN